MGLAIAILKYNPFWIPLEKYKVSDVLPKMMGKHAYKILWEPLLFRKFGTISIRGVYEKNIEIDNRRNNGSHSF